MAELVGNDTRRVRAHRHEAGMAQRELAGVAVDEIETDGENDVNADIVEDIEPVGIDELGSQRDQKTQGERAQQTGFGVAQVQVHTFSTSFLPSKPDGLTSRMTIRMAKAMASR